MRRSSGPTCSATPAASARKPSRTSRHRRSRRASRTSCSCRPTWHSTIHESIGHSTELDRALGYEANYAGTSFLTTDKLGKFRVGSDIVNFNGDRTRPESLSTCGYDDDGVKTRQFPIIKAGIFVGYQTIRDQAHLIGQTESMGCCYADSYASVPFQRMPNVWLEPSRQAGDPRRPGLGGRRRHPDRRPGLVLDRPAAVQLPVRRRRLLGDQGREGPGHDRRRRLPEPHAGFLGVPATGSAARRSGKTSASTRDGKGQPGQINAMSHGCAPSRFRRINVLRTS